MSKKIQAVTANKNITVKAPKAAKEVTVTKQTEIKEIKEVAAEAPPAITVAAPAATTAAVKRTYTTIGKDGVTGRRNTVALATAGYLATVGKPVRQADIYKAVCAATGLPLTPTVWNDLSKALEAITQSGTAAFNKADKKRGTYSLVVPEAPAEATTEAAVEA